jgi:hypothetical protein
LNKSLILKRIFGLIRYKVKIDNIRSPFGEPFNENNHWIRTLKEYDSGIRNYKDTSLYKYHQEFQPKSIFSLIEFKDKKLKRELENKYPLGSYPWGIWTIKSTKEDWKRSRHCGPSSDNLIMEEWNNFIKLYEKIKLEGLNFKKYGLPVGFIMKDEFSQRYFFVLGGNHRIAIIKHLNIKNTITVRLISYTNMKQFISFDMIKNIKETRELFNNLISNKFNENIV